MKKIKLSLTQYYTTSITKYLEMNKKEYDNMEEEGSLFNYLEEIFDDIEIDTESEDDEKTQLDYNMTYLEFEYNVI